MRECGIDEIGSLNSIIELARGDLTKNRLLVTCRKLSRTTTRVVFLVGIDFPTNPTYSTHAYTSSIMDLMMRIVLFKERKHRRAFVVEMSLMMVVEDQEGKGSKFNML